MPRYEIMKPKHSDYYISEPVYYSREWAPTVAGPGGDVVTSDSETFVQKLKPKTIYVPHKKKPTYVKYTSPRYVRREPVKVIRASNGNLIPVVHEYRPHAAKHHLKPIEVISRYPHGKHVGTAYVEDTASLDEKSISQYSNMSLDVSCDMSTINRDVEAILQQYEKVLDDTILTEYEKRVSTGNDEEEVIIYKNQRDQIKKRKPEKLTQEQIKILSMDKPPLDKLKDVPVQYLKPRLPPYLKENKVQNVETKRINEIEKNDFNTNDLLKGLLLDMNSKGLTGNLINISNKNIEINNQKCVGTQTVNKVDITVDTMETSTEPITVISQQKIVDSKILENETTSKPKYTTTYPDLTNLEFFLDKSIKYDLNISNNEINDTNLTNHSCPNCINNETICTAKEFCDDSCKEKEKSLTNLMVEKNNNEAKLKDNKEKVCENISEKNTNSLRECISDLTHSRNQERENYANKNNKYKPLVNWEYDDSISNDKSLGGRISGQQLSFDTSFNHRLFPLKDSSFTSFSTESFATQPFSLKSEESLRKVNSNDRLKNQTSSVTNASPQAKNVFALPSYSKDKLAFSVTNTITEKPPLSMCQPLAGGDNCENQKKIMQFMADCFSKRNDADINKSMDLLNQKIEQLDPSICVEIMRRLTETLMKQQPDPLPTSDMTKSVHLTILKQLRTDHLRHIQQEIKHIEDLDEFLHNFDVGIQISNVKEKTFQLQDKFNENEFSK